MGQILEKVPYKRRYPYGPHICERMLGLSDQKQYHLTTSEWLKLKPLTTPSAGEDVKQVEFSYVVCWW